MSDFLVKQKFRGQIVFDIGIREYPTLIILENKSTKDRISSVQLLFTRKRRDTAGLNVIINKESIKNGTNRFNQDKNSETKQTMQNIGSTVETI